VWKLLALTIRVFLSILPISQNCSAPLRLDAFEHYIRGVLASDDDARMRELREAARST